MSKVKTILALKKELKKLKSQGKKIVFTNGCFDLIHPGHIKILTQAKQKGDVLIVGLNSDLSIKKIKDSSRPILNQKARIKVLESIEVVDYIILFDQQTPYSLIKTLKPEVLVKGGDWKTKSIIGSDLVKKVYRVKLCSGYSTSAIISKIKKKSG